MNWRRVFGADWKEVVREESDEHDEEGQFDEAKRDGVEALKTAGYVERADFEPAVMAQLKADPKKLIGYFCASCAYYRQKKSALHGSICIKLGNAEDAPWGCCNIWEYAEPGSQGKTSEEKEGG